MDTSYREQARATFAEPIVTSRLSIGPLQTGDESAFTDFLNADGGVFPRREHRQIPAYEAPPPFTEDRVRTEIIPALQDYHETKPGPQLYIRTKSDGRIIGMIDFSVDNFGRNRVGYFVLPSERRKGYAFEAYAATVNQAVRTGFLTGSLYAHTDPENTLSQKFLQKAGFEKLGRIETKNTEGDDIEVVAFTRRLDPGRPLGPEA